MKIIIDMGHSVTNPGSSGYLDEVTETHSLGKVVKRILESHGHTVIDASEDNGSRVKANALQRELLVSTKADLFCAIHFRGNTNTNGVVVWCNECSGRAWSWANEIGKSLAKCLVSGEPTIYSHGEYEFLHRTDYPELDYPAVIVDVGDVTKATDAKAYWNSNYELMAKAICRAIDGIEDNDGK